MISAVPGAIAARNGSRWSRSCRRVDLLAALEKWGSVAVLLRTAPGKCLVIVATESAPSASVWNPRMYATASRDVRSASSPNVALMRVHRGSVPGRSAGGAQHGTRPPCTPAGRCRRTRVPALGADRPEAERLRPLRERAGHDRQSAGCRKWCRGSVDSATGTARAVHSDPLHGVAPLRERAAVGQRAEHAEVRQPNSAISSPRRQQGNIGSRTRRRRRRRSWHGTATPLSASDTRHENIVDPLVDRGTARPGTGTGRLRVGHDASSCRWATCAERNPEPARVRPARQVRER